MTHNSTQDENTTIASAYGMYQMQGTNQEQKSGASENPSITPRIYVQSPRLFMPPKQAAKTLSSESRGAPLGLVHCHQSGNALPARKRAFCFRRMRQQSRINAMATPEENSKLVLAMYKHFHKKPDQVLFARDFQSYVVEKSLDVEDMKSGLAYGYEQKWFEDGPNGTIRLTQAGFDLLPPA